MKSYQLITAALLSLGLISSASASGTATISGTTYTVVYITGSTTSRQILFNAVDSGSTGLFDSTPTLQPSNATGSTSIYNAYGTVGGQPYLLSVDLTGSEAGLAALEGTTIANNPTAPSLSGYVTTANLGGTPAPTGFINPNGGTAITAAPDLALSDTSQAVSLSSSKSALTDYGIVGISPYVWAKGKFTSPDSSWNDLVNVTDPQLNYQLGGSQTASFFTGNAADQDDVYTIGRNKGSSARVNALLDTQHGVGNAVDQWVPANSTYVSGVLTVGAVESISVAGGLVEVSNDGYDVGSGVSGALKQDANGATDSFGSQIITLGYLGLTDASTATNGGAALLTLNGVAENDASVQNGTYSFWGHSHLYGIPNQSTSSAGGVIARKFAGTSPNESQGTASTLTGAFAAQYIKTGAGANGGWESNPTTTQSASLDPATVHANKPSDAGYPSQQN